MMYYPIKLRDLTPANLRYYHDQHRFMVVSAGRRSRKTLISDRKVLTDPGRGALVLPGYKYYLLAPTHNQAKQIYWERIKRDTRLFWSKIPSESSLLIKLKNGSEIQVSGLDRPERIEGQSYPPIKGIHITEMASIKARVWENNIRPLLSDNNGFAIIDGVPEGRNHYYQMALYACGGVIPETQPLQGAYGENPDDPEWSFHSWWSSDVLPPGEIDSAKRQLDSRTFDQEYRGSFVSYAGNLYYTFKPDHVKDIPVNPDLPLWLTCDFNKSPMVWEVAQESGNTIKFIDEIAIGYNAKTKHNVINFCNRFKDHRQKVVYLTGDPANNVESHRDFTTDYMMIREVLESQGWKVLLKVMTAHPSINNRVNVFCSLLEHNRVLVDRKCRYLIMDLERNESDDKGGKDKSDPSQTHASDSADYLIWLLYAREFYGVKVIQN